MSRPEVFGASAAVFLSAWACARGIIRESDGPGFSSWLLDTYRDEDSNYVTGLDLRTLFGRYCAVKS